MGVLHLISLVESLSWISLFGATAVAASSTFRHLRLSRVARYVDRPGAEIHEGPALLRGVVEAFDDEPDTPVLSMEAPGLEAHDVRWRSSARSFLLRLPSGAALRVEPEEERWLLDITFAPVERPDGTRYLAELRPGNVVYVHGEVRREIDARTAGSGYRDAARAWVVRASPRHGLRLCSSEVVARHLTRAGFHGRWAVGLAGALAVATGWAVLLARQEHTLGRLLVLPVIAVAALYQYWDRAEDSAPWVTRRVPR